MSFELKKMNSTLFKPVSVLAGILAFFAGLSIGLSTNSSPIQPAIRPPAVEFESSVRQADRKAILDHLEHSPPARFDPDGNPVQDSGPITILTPEGKTISNKPSEIRVGKIIKGKNIAVFENDEEVAIPGDVP